MKNLRQFGEAAMTLTDVVDDFCLAQGNVRETMYVAILRHARWAWKELFRRTLWSTTKWVVEVDCHTGTIILPDSCERVFLISVVDKFGRLHPLTEDTDFNTARINCAQVKCSCNNCAGQNTLCGAMDTISAVLTTVVVNGAPYTQTTYTRYNGNGTINKETITPSWDQATSTVIYNTNIETICNVETTDCGCIKITEPNIATLRANFGVGNFNGRWGAAGVVWGNQSPFHELIQAPYNNWGYWNRNAENPQIIHIFGGRKPAQGQPNNGAPAGEQLVGNIQQVIIDGQTNGETPGTEILVPEYAVNAMQIGMVYQMKFLNMRVTSGDKLEAKRAWTQAQIDVAKYLNPMNMEVIAKLQTNERLW